MMKSYRDGRTRRAGLSMLELVVAVAIVGVLAAMVVPAIQRTRAAAARAGCANQLGQLALGVQMYSGARGALPKGCDYPFLKPPARIIDQSGVSWQTSILPFVEQGSLWDAAWAAHTDSPRGVSWAHWSIARTVVPAFLCPSETIHQGGYSERIRWGGDQLSRGRRH